MWEYLAKHKETKLFGVLQVFVPDCMNQFCVQSEAEALLEKQERDILPQLSTPKTPSKYVPFNASVGSKCIYTVMN